MRAQGVGVLIITEDKEVDEKILIALGVENEGQFEGDRALGHAKVFLRNQVFGDWDQMRAQFRRVHQRRNDVHTQRKRNLKNEEKYKEDNDSFLSLRRKVDV